MKYLRFSTNPKTEPAAPPSSPEVFWGVFEGDEVRELGPGTAGVPPALGAGEKASFSGPTYKLDQVRLLPPCWPSKIICVGRNYVAHAKELEHDVPTSPLIFSKPPSSLIAHGDVIQYPEDVARLDYEGEIAIVMGRRLRHLGADESATPYIFGYTCLNDVTGRDLQNKDGQWTRAKGYDTFCPLGPVIATGLDVTQLEVRSFLNGQQKQQGHVSQMIFNFDVVLRYISRVMTLEPGDIIATGTPAGVGPMVKGDTVEVAIEGVGVLRNRVGGPS